MVVYTRPHNLHTLPEQGTSSIQAVKVRKPNATVAPRQARPQLLGGFAGEFSPKGHSAPTFPQVSRFDTAQHPPKTTQKSRPMAKSTPISCKTIQKSQGACSRAKSDVNRECKLGTARYSRSATKPGEGRPCTIAQAERGVPGKTHRSDALRPTNRVNGGRRCVQEKLDESPRTPEHTSVPRSRVPCSRNANANADATRKPALM